MVDDRIIELAKLDRAAEIQDMAERAKIQASLADRALQSLMIANGGALVALFTLVGKAGSVHFDMSLLKIAFAAFALGLGLTLAAHLLAFLSQERFMHTAWHRKNRHDRTIMSIHLDENLNPGLTDFNRGMAHYRNGLIVFGFAVASFVIGCLLALLAVA